MKKDKPGIALPKLSVRPSDRLKNLSSFFSIFPPPPVLLPSNYISNSNHIVEGSEDRGMEGEERQEEREVRVKDFEIVDNFIKKKKSIVHIIY